MKSRSMKKKGKHGKYSVEFHNGKYSTLYITKIWKLNMSLLMPEQTVLRDSSICRDLCVFALLRFIIVENRVCIVSFLLVL